MQTLILTPTRLHIARAADAIRRGEPVGMPTETVYGLAADARDAGAVDRVFAVKGRPAHDPLIVHVLFRGTLPESLGQLVAWEQLSTAALWRAEALARRFWPGPLTLVLPRGPEVAGRVTAGLRTVAVRAPRHPVAQALLEAAGVPLAAPSANRFGHISPTSAGDVVAELGGRISFVVDGGPCEVGLESTVLAVEPDGELVLLRPGGISAAAIARVAETWPRWAEAGSPVSAPGMLDRHYAPRTPFALLPAPVLALDEAAWDKVRASIAIDVRRLGLVVLSGEAAAAGARLAAETGREVEAVSLSHTGDLAEAARGLFREMRRLDEGQAELLLAEPVTAQGPLAEAITDRLRRAARGLS